MNRRTHELDTLLRTAAVPVDRVRARQAPAQALLERIVATPRSSEPEAADAPSRTPRPARRRLVGAALAAGAAAALSVGLVVLPGLSGSPAYASWRATSEPLPPSDLRAIGEWCVAQVAPHFHDGGATLGTAERVLGERRGDYGLVYVVAARWSATCFRDREGALHNASESTAAATTAQLGRRGVDLGGWAGLTTHEGTARFMVGHVGRDVAGVDIDTTDHRLVHATVRDGYFLAWYPESDPSSGRPTTLTLRLADGATVPGLSARDLMEAPYLG